MSNGFYILGDSIYKKTNIDIGVSSTSSTLNWKSENDSGIVNHISNIDLFVWWV